MENQEGLAWLVGFIDRLPDDLHVFLKCLEPCARFAVGLEPRLKRLGGYNDSKVCAANAD